MYSNYFLINNEFLSHFPEYERRILSDRVYQAYVDCLRPKSKKLAMDDYFSSSRIKYPVLFFLCPKCKKAMFFRGIGKKSANDLKYCAMCGEPNIIHRYNTGRSKIVSMLRISREFHDDREIVKYQNQQLLVLICSVLEVYLREFYADILNTKFVISGSSLYEKFLKDCKNDFLNPGKTQDRLKKELSIDYKNTIGRDAFRIITDISNARNVVVHNNGICDSAYLKLYPHIEKYSELSPTTESVASYLYIMDYIVTKMDELYCNQLLDAVVATLIPQIHSPDFSLWPHND